MKSLIQYFLQRLLGYERYLYVFARFKIRTLRWDGKENDFFVFLSLLPRNSTYLDIGANLGIMTWFLSRHDTSSTVMAFEPVPENFRTLQHVVRATGLTNTVLHACALGQELGSAEMVVPVVDKVKKQGLSHMVHQELTDFNEGDTVTVPVETLDTFPDLQNVNVGGIKLDVENFEYFVLRGGETLLRKSQPVIYTELWENENRHKCFAFLAELGYSPWVVHQGSLVQHDPDVHRTQNFIFQPSEAR